MSLATLAPRLSLSIVLVFLLPGMTRAQGEFINFETPQVKPIDVATLGDVDFLLVCNTPDNSLEIYEADPPHKFVQRVPVGLGPVTVRWNEEAGKAFVCNFSGNSVSIVRLEPESGSVEPPVVGKVKIRAVLERTDFVGDEPSDICFLGPMFAVVTLSSQSGVTLRRTEDLGLVVPLHSLTYNDPSGSRFATKQPRVIETLPDGRVFALNFMGDHKAFPGQLYDLDLYVYDPTSGDAYPYRIAGGMGTTNHSFAVSRDGSRTFVVGTRAQNLSAVGVEGVSKLKTGFVQSFMWVVDTIPGQEPTVVPEAPGGGLAGPDLPSINLNRDYSQDSLAEVSRDEALSQPTDILLMETRDVSHGIEKVFITAFHSDKVAVLHPDSSEASGWRIKQIEIVNDNIYDLSVTGPRGLAYSPNATDPRTNGRPGLVFVANRLNNSVSVINPHTEEAIDQFSLQNDPTPLVIREGRKWLYSADRFSGNGMVSCASCHVDGRTDGLPWNLGDLNIGPKIDSWFHDGSGQTIETMPNFPSDKGPMVTQTLQGLVNSQVNREMQALFSNAPYHWRGDMRRLEDFNVAFVNLQGMRNIGTPEDPRGIGDQEMEEFADFMNTIVHPPNPEQNWHRRLSGSFGDDPNDPTDGSGAKLGMKIFHIQPIVGARSCVSCHTLPDGSSNTATELAFVPSTLGTVDQIHPIETAAMRNMFQREMLLHRDFKLPAQPFVQTANFGLVHHGDPLGGPLKSINDFVGNVFLDTMPGPTDEEKVVQVEALIEFTRTLDTGIAPLVGFAYTFIPGSALNRTILWILEQHVGEADIGMSVYTRSDGVEKGYYFDLTASPPGYREEGTSKFISRTALEDLAGSDDGVVIVQATPVGSERRIANLKGKATLIQQYSQRPSEIVLESMAPGPHWLGVAEFTALDPTPNMPSSHSLRALQEGVVGGGYGVPDFRHEAPRRFRVTGKNIRHGATLLLSMSTETPNDLPVRSIRMPLFPTKFEQDGKRIWETASETDAMITMALLNGGLWAPGVTEVMTGVIPPSEPLNPDEWNFFGAAVLNEDNTISLPGEGQRLRVQDGREGVVVVIPTDG